MRAESREPRVESRKLEASVRRVVATSSLVLRPSTAFTLLELLTVLGIMAIIAALAVPALKNFGHSDAMTAADQQFLGDVARARQLAMSQRTTVYMVFVPMDFLSTVLLNHNLTAAQWAVATNLCSDQLTGYTFMSDGQVGDQPGQHQWHYLAPWQSLPGGTFIPLWKFNQASPPFKFSDPIDSSKTFSIYPFNTANKFFPFPTENSALTGFLKLPYIAFNYQGQLTTNGVGIANLPEYIPLARGSVLPAINPDTHAYQTGAPQVIENPPGNSTNTYNIIEIDPLTGRATLHEPKIQ